MNKGIFCISIDFELIWGRLDLTNLDYFKDRVLKERQVIDKLLILFTKYKVPVTWATVGKLYEKGNMLHSGLDIIKKIESVPNQEIGSHSYSHPVFTDISRSRAIEEFNKFKKQSFVFPRNKIKYLKYLKKAGFKSYRGADRNQFELIAPRTTPTYSPTFNQGLLNIQGSMYIVSGRGLKRYIPKGLRYIKSKIGIDQAIRKNQVFHLWFHPVDFVDDSKKIFSDFEKILKYADHKRSSGQIEILNMNQIYNKISK